MRRDWLTRVDDWKARVVWASAPHTGVGYMVSRRVPACGLSIHPGRAPGARSLGFYPAPVTVSVSVSVLGSVSGSAKASYAGWPGRCP